MEFNIAPLAALIGVPARAAILTTLMDGKLLPAGELAYRAFISSQTASMHLAKMVSGGLLALEVRGRHRYYRIASQEVAQVLESMVVLAAPAPLRALPENENLRRMRFARMCYDHLAGKVGVALTQQLLRAGILESVDCEFLVTPSGNGWFTRMNIDLATINADQSRIFARQCLDWSERREHISGALGAALARRLLELGWLSPIPKIRALQLTAIGRKELVREFPTIQL